MECSVFPDTIPDMQISEREPLKNKTTLRIGGNARYFIRTEDVQDAVAFANQKNLPLFILGGGSNIVLPDDELCAVVVQPDHSGFEVVEDNKESVLLRIGASENLDSFIQKTVENNWWGLENLSFVPGSVGGLAVQNVGAYGVEAKDYIESVDVFDIQKHSYKTLSANECGFGYRQSIFNRSQKERYIITHITLRLSKVPKPVLAYRGVSERVENKTQQHIRDTIIAIRKEKDLDPERVWSVGSFFKNIEADDISRLPEEIQQKCFAIDSGYKIPSGALIESAGLKGFCIGDACVSQTQANMLINKKNASRKDFESLYKHICKAINEKYGLPLIHEPEFVRIEV